MGLLRSESVASRPSPNYFGPATFTFRAWDMTAESAGSVVDVSVNGDTTPYSSATDTAEISVTPVNDVPSFVKGPNQTVLEDAGPQSIFPWATSISAGPPNESSQQVDFLVSNNNNALFSAQPQVAPDGTLT
ncbi:MAG: hypothetical protein L0Z62_32625, partial [Gemmataceae bacterium]|nr:hypothetical protein [Gemmataceae bacterium]